MSKEIKLSFTKKDFKIDWFNSQGAYGQINVRIRDYQSRVNQLEHFAKKLENEIRVESGLTCPGNIRNDQD